MTVKWLNTSGSTWWSILKEYSPKWSLLLNNQRCCMMKKLKALPASSPWHILQSSDFLQPLCTPSHCKPIQEFCFQYSSKQSSDLLEGPVLPPSLQPGTAWLWLSVQSCATLLLPSAHHQRELGRRGMDPAVVYGKHHILHQPGKCSMERKDTTSFHLCHLSRSLPKSCSSAQGWNHSCSIMIHDVCSQPGVSLCPTVSSCRGAHGKFCSLVVSGKAHSKPGVAAALEWCSRPLLSKEHVLNTHPHKSPLLIHISLCTDLWELPDPPVEGQATCFTGMWGGSSII